MQREQVPIPPVIGIAGGHGGMGSLFARLLRDVGATVVVSDRDTEVSNRDLAARCDVILVAVPLRVTSAVLADLAPLVGSHAALVSLGSLMEPALPALEGCRGEAFLLHPLFGPGRRDLHGATLALAPLHPGPHQEWLLSVLRRQGATVIETAPEQHDRAMAVAQALLHGSYAALAPQLLGGLPAADPLSWASPTLRVQLALMSRILHQNPTLYGDLIALNRYAPAAFEGAIARLEDLRRAAAEGPDAVAAFVAAARDSLGLHGLALAVEGNRLLNEEP